MVGTPIEGKYVYTDGNTRASNRAREAATPTRSRSAGGRFEWADAASAGGRDSFTISLSAPAGKSAERALSSSITNTYVASRSTSTSRANALRVNRP